MVTQKLKGLWIPVEILLNKDLSDKEKIILSMILYLSEETKSCFASNKYIASIVNVTANRVSKIISSLKEKQYIKVKLKYKDKIYNYTINNIWEEEKTGYIHINKTKENQLILTTCSPKNKDKQLIIESILSK